MKTAQRAIVVAGCLGSIYTQLTTSTAAIHFCRHLGGDGLHIGILAAIPCAMVFMQFLAAHCANHVRFRKPYWFILSVLQRICYLPVALGAWLHPEAGAGVWLWAFLGMSVVEQGLLQFCTPLWMSWMGDYLPRRGLSEYWGARHRWTHWAAAGCLAGSAWFFSGTNVDVVRGFACMVILGTVVGLVDLCLFLKVDEPPVVPARDVRLAAAFADPFRDNRFRSFIGYSCFWYLSAMVGAPFISMFLLDYVGMSLANVLALWTVSWIGGALSARWLGRLAERYGNRPVLILAVLLKSTNMLCLLATPADPLRAWIFLAPMFLFDAVLNAAILIGNNGFLLKNSPAENRTMFIAAGQAVAGMVGGVTSIACGAMLSRLQANMGGLSLWFPSGYHVMFTASMLLRIVAVWPAVRIHEPQSSGAWTLLRGVLGLRGTAELAAPAVELPAVTIEGQELEGVLVRFDESSPTSPVSDFVGVPATAAAVVTSAAGGFDRSAPRPALTSAEAPPAVTAS